MAYKKAIADYRKDHSIDAPVEERSKYYRRCFDLELKDYSKNPHSQIKPGKPLFIINFLVMLAVIG